MKTKLHELLRWVLAPILATCLLAWFVTPAYPKNAEPKVSVHAQAASHKADASADSQEVRKLIDELQAREREDYTLVLEGQRKTMDWWFGFLAIVTAILAVFGALIPYLMGRKDRELIEQDKVEIERMLNDAQATVARIRQEEKEASELKLKMYQSGQSDDQADEIKEAVTAVQKDQTSDITIKLRAEAIAASQAKQADKAYALWRALTELDSTDASAHSNAGYWAQNLGETSQGGESLRWLKQAGQHYSQALSFDPNDQVSAFNWGIALNAEADAIATIDLNAARKLWQQAGNKYQQAFSLNLDDHETANNWGAVLAAEAQAISASDLSAARKLWQQARDKYQQTLNIKSDNQETIFNWGEALAAEARAIVSIDLDAARKLWQQAGKKYQQAFSLKPDDHETANAWGLALLYEADALPPMDSEQARLLRDRAEQILLEFSETAPGEVAYNLACIYGVRGDVASCLRWLKTGQAHNTLPDCIKLESDPDLAVVRTSSEFIEWLKTVCP